MRAREIRKATPIKPRELLPGQLRRAGSVVEELDIELLAALRVDISHDPFEEVVDELLQLCCPAGNAVTHHVVQPVDGGL